MARQESRLSAGDAPLARPGTLAPLAVVVAIATVVCAVYWPTLVSMAAVWARSQTFAHGFLIPPVVAWLLYRQRATLAASRPAVSALGAAALGACILAWLAGTVVQADVLAQGAVVAMVPSALLLTLGPATVRALGFPLLFGMLAVPAGEFLIEPMMDLTAHGSVFLLTVSGVPVYQDGWLISIPGGNFQVADACSGVRYLIGAATSGVLFAWLFFGTLKKRLLFMAFVIFLTVLANVVRAYIIILLAHLTDMRLAVGVDHFVYGWFLFSLLLVVVFAVGLRFADGPVSAAGDVAARPGFMAGLRAGAARHGLAMLSAVGLMLAGPWAGERLAAGLDRGGALSLPVRVGAARAAGPAPAPAWLRPAAGWTARHLAFQGGPVPFELHVFEAAPGRAGRDLTGLREQLAAESLTLVADEPMRASAPGRGSLDMRETRLQQGGRELLLAWWLAVGSQGTANPVTAKLLQVRTMLRGEHIKPAMIVVAVETQGLDQPGASLRAIAAEVAESLSACLDPGLRESRQCQTTARVAQ